MVSFLGIPASKPSTKDSVLVIVDAQNEYDHGLLAISDVQSSRAVIGSVLKKYREADGDVVCEVIRLLENTLSFFISLFSPLDPTSLPFLNRRERRRRKEEEKARYVVLTTKH